MHQAKEECHYNPTYFARMLAEFGGVGTAKKLIEKGIATGHPSDGFTSPFYRRRGGILSKIAW